MKKILAILFAFFIFVSSIFAASDDSIHDITVSVPEIVIMELNGTSEITLTVTAPTAGNAGNFVTGDSDNSKYLYYTTLVANGTTRTITAQLDANFTTGGIGVQLTATPDGGTNEGTSAGVITLDNTAKVIVNNIGSCATGRGIGQGTQLLYELIITDETALEVGAGDTVTITLTLTDY